MLIKLSSGDIGLGKPTNFAVYSGDGKLLLRKGHVVDSRGLLERLYRWGHREREEAADATRTGSRTTMKPAAAGNTEPSKLLFSTANLSERQTGESPNVSKKTRSLPNLRQNVEFFHLTREGSADVFSMELTGVIPDEALIARHTGHDAPELTTGMVYEARLFAGSRVFKFSTRLLSDSFGPLGCHFLQYPEVVSQALVRRHHRVPTSISGRLQTNEYQRPATNVLVENMSSIGAGISAGEDFLTVGQSALLTMNLSIENRTRHVSVPVEVRNRRQEGERFKYGLELVQVSDEVRRDIKDFVLESVAVG